MRARQRQRSRVVEVSPMPRRVSPPVPTLSKTFKCEFGELKTPLTATLAVTTPPSGLPLQHLLAPTTKSVGVSAVGVSPVGVLPSRREATPECCPLDLSMPKCEPPLNLSMKSEMVAEFKNEYLGSLGNVLFSLVLLKF